MIHVFRVQTIVPFLVVLYFPASLIDRPSLESRPYWYIGDGIISYDKSDILIGA